MNYVRISEELGLLPGPVRFRGSRYDVRLSEAMNHSRFLFCLKSLLKDQD